MPRLGVNIDHIATLRELRHSHEPELINAACICEASGADSIVVHLREDRRHIQEQDVTLLRKTVKTQLNLEMSVADEIVDFACKVRPDRSTLVPEKRRELTTEGGLDAAGNQKSIREALRKLQGNGIPVSLFIDPDKKQIGAAVDLGVSMIELHTGRYANALQKKDRTASLREIKDAAVCAMKQGLQVFAGHGLDYRNVSRIVNTPEIKELNIGYSIVCRAVIVGISEAVREMKMLLTQKPEL
jgi:pyridoxine 5-phosphate synthase